MATRTLSAHRNPVISIDPLRVNAQKLKKARGILGSASDVDTLNTAVSRQF